MLFFFLLAATVSIVHASQSPSTAMTLSFDVWQVIFEFVDDLRSLAETGRYFWNAISCLLLLRLYNHRFTVNDIQVGRIRTQDLVGSPLASLLCAFGIPKRPIDVNFVARNLGIFLLSPVFQQVFSQSFWSRLQSSEVFLQQQEQLEMFQNDLPKTVLRKFDASLSKNMTTRLYALASLPLEAGIISRFLDNSTIMLLNPFTEEVFSHVYEKIAKRLILLPVPLLLQRYLALFAFDFRLVEIIVRKLVQTRRFSDLSLMLEYNIPTHFRLTGHHYFGCVSSDSLVLAVENDLNSLSSPIAQRLVKFAAVSASKLRVYANPRECKTDILRHDFHAHLLHKDWVYLRRMFANPELAEQLYPESFDFLSSMEPAEIFKAIKNCPEMARLHTLLLDGRYQRIHFDSLKSLKSLRRAMKEVVMYPNVLSAYINYVESEHPALYSVLAEDSLSRIVNYFDLKLNSVERKRYKIHPSFIVAIASLDVILARRLEEAQSTCEYFDKEEVFRQFLLEMHIMPADGHNYFELAHTFPSFADAMMPLSSLSVSSQFSRQETGELTAAASFFNIHRVINGCGFIRYDLILRLIRQYKSSLTFGIIPVDLLRQIVKSAVFFMTKTRESKRLPFKASVANSMRALLMILTIQGAGQAAAIKKLHKNNFPGTAIDNTELQLAIAFYRENLSTCHFIPINSEDEAFVIKLVKSLLETTPLGSLESSIERSLAFFGIVSERDSLLIPQLRTLISIAHFELE